MVMAAINGYISKKLYVFVAYPQFIAFYILKLYTVPRSLLWRIWIGAIPAIA